MKRIAILSTAVAIASLFGSSIASADIMVGSSGAAFQAWPSTINNYSDPNHPFWDNPSKDGGTSGGPQNIGNYIKGPFNDPVAPGAVSPGVSNATWWGKSGNTAATMDTNCYFSRGTSTGPIVADLVVKSSDNGAADLIGWYDVDHPTTKAVLWNGAATSTSNFEAVFTPTTHWGFYMNTPYGTYYMQSSLSELDTASQHMAVFQDNATPGNEHYYVGFEDLAASPTRLEKDGDFNDVIIKFQSTGGGSPPVPEPASLALLGIGASALMIRRRK